MIRVFLSQRHLKSLSKLTTEQRAKANEVLLAVMDGFGEPHQHARFGLRKLTAGNYECRLDLRWRILLRLRGDNLLAVEVMDHNEIRTFLRYA